MFQALYALSNFWYGKLKSPQRIGFIPEKCLKLCNVRFLFMLHLLLKISFPVGMLYKYTFSAAPNAAAAPIAEKKGHKMRIHQWIQSVTFGRSSFSNHTEMMAFWVTVRVFNYYFYPILICNRLWKELHTKHYINTTHTH